MPEGRLISEQNLSQPLTVDQLRAAVEKTLASFTRVRKMLLLHPDYSRSDYTDILFNLIYKELSNKWLHPGLNTNTQLAPGPSEHRGIPRPYLGAAI